MHGDIRELVISYGRTGYIALYRFVVPQGEVRVLAIRHHRGPIEGKCHARRRAPVETLRERAKGKPIPAN